MAARRVPIHHAHGCLGCGRRYTDSCTTPLANGHCPTCRTGAPPTLLDRNHLPQECCRTVVLREDGTKLAQSRLITDKDELNKYALGGMAPWFRCRVCSRTHPFDPSKIDQIEEPE